MLGIFRKRDSANDFAKFLERDGWRYADLISSWFSEMDPGTRAHVLVAYKNILPVLSVGLSVARKRGESFTVEGFIPELITHFEAAQHARDEVATRRWAWFLFACLIGRLEKLARTDSRVLEVGAEVWCALATEAPRLKVVLPHNLVWKPEEKEWFDLSLKDEELIGWVLNHLMPPMVAKLDSVRAFAKGRNVFYWPSSSRIGVIP